MAEDRKHFAELSESCREYSVRANGKRYYFHIKRMNDELNGIACISGPKGKRIAFPKEFRVCSVDGIRRYPAAKADEWYLMASIASYVLMYGARVLLKFECLKLPTCSKAEDVHEDDVVLLRDTTKPNNKQSFLLKNVMY